MWLKHLEGHNFRNYQHIDINFSSGLNIFLGKNAQGKTNILEAIYFLALTRSHRTRSDKDLITFNKEHLKISGNLVRTTGKLPLDILLDNKGRITKVNHIKQKKLSNYIGYMNVILFAPEDLQLIKGSPGLRRKFMDMELGQIKPIYLSDLSTYNHILKQRNNYLKQTEHIDLDYLSVLDSQLADYGSRVISHRLDFLRKLEVYANVKHKSISDSDDNLLLRYKSSISFNQSVNIKSTLLTELDNNRQRDIAKKNTSIGPHRDDFEFFINDMNAGFSSQGQQRSIILSIKLAEIDLMKFLTQETPILLLDDVMSELDNHRQIKLLEILKEDIQTFLTTTSLDHLHSLPQDLKIFKVKQGHIYD